MPNFSIEQFQLFYERVYPVDDVARWISYNLPVVGESDDATLKRNARSLTYLHHREFCFTLIGDIFTRFRSFASGEALRAELMKRGPEKIDIGAVYNAPTTTKAIQTIIPKERELVFDIDMSDYDQVRSCCSGKSICVHCWPWMACAAKILHHILTEDFGFKFILPVFSGRRGIHLWVCDRRARQMADEDRAAIVGYMSVVQGHNRTAVGSDLSRNRPIHPTLDHVSRAYLEPTFTRIFLSDTDSVNNVSNARGAAVVYGALAQALRDGWKGRELEGIPVPAAQPQQQQGVGVGEPAATATAPAWPWPAVQAQLAKSNSLGALRATCFSLLYPRLDVNVSTRKDHLLKLPFCIHPGTGSLCVPLQWDSIDDFDPVADPPKLPELLIDGVIEPRWVRPLTCMLEDMAQDSSEVQMRGGGGAGAATAADG